MAPTWTLLALCAVAAVALESGNPDPDYKSENDLLKACHNVRVDYETVEIAGDIEEYRLTGECGPNFTEAYARLNDYIANDNATLAWRWGGRHAESCRHCRGWWPGVNDIGYGKSYYYCCNCMGKDGIPLDGLESGDLEWSLENGYVLDLAKQFWFDGKRLRPKEII